MQTPLFLNDIFQVLLFMATPAATCTLVLAGMALCREGGVSFSAGGEFQKWMLWTAVFLTVPQILAWFAAQGLGIPATSGGAAGSWARQIETSIQGFVSTVVITRVIPLIAAFFVLKAVLDAAQGNSPLGSVVAAIFVLAITGTLQMMQGWKSSSQFATTDMLASFWNYLADTILPAAAGLAVVAAVANYVRHKPFLPIVGAALGFLSVSAIWKLVQAMVS